MAPRAADQPAYMQSMMRKYLTQGSALAPDDIKSNVFDANKSMLDGMNNTEEKPITPAAYAAPKTRTERAGHAIGSLGGGLGNDIKW